MKYFGTDGIRGIAGIELGENLAYKCGYALGSLSRGGLIFLARDTRESGGWLAEALGGGATDAGASLMYGGVLPTPAAAVAVKEFGAHFGAVISASHNPAHYNGIKLFDALGRKLDRETEAAIEALIDAAPLPKRISPLFEDSSARAVYMKKLLSEKLNLKGLKVVLDAANGAASAIAREVFEASGASVTAISDEGDGSFINYRCGALNPEAMRQTVLAKKADIGFAFDGDADRVIAADDKGRIVDGDGILYVLSLDLKRAGRLVSDTLVATVMTNCGVENALAEHGIRVVRVAVGDHNVCAEMQKRNYTLGGEQSGHIIIADTGTGDGIYAALKLASIVGQNGALSALYNVKTYPQMTRNVPSLDKKISERAAQAAEGWQKWLNGKGRVLLRASGTEPAIRITAECESYSAANMIIADLERALKSV